MIPEDHDGPDNSTANRSSIPFDAVVLAGGACTRMGALTTILPKALLPWGDRPIINHILSELHRAGCQHVVVLTGTEESKLLGQHVVRSCDTDWPVVTVHHSGYPDLSSSLRDLPWSEAAPTVMLAHCDELIASDLTASALEASRSQLVPVIAAHDLDVDQLVHTSVTTIDPVGPGDGVNPTHRFVGRYCVPIAVLQAAWERNFAFTNILEVLADHLERGSTVLEISGSRDYWDLGTAARYVEAWSRYHVTASARVDP